MSVGEHSGRAFVDTNIFIYAFDTTAMEKKVRAESLLDRLWKSESGCLSVQVLQEFYVNFLRKGSNPPSPDEARRRVSELMSWRVHEPNSGDVLAAIQLHQEVGISFWDAMIAQSASKLGCEILYSEDLNPGQKIAGVEVVNPFS